MGQFLKEYGLETENAGVRDCLTIASLIQKRESESCRDVVDHLTKNLKYLKSIRDNNKSCQKSSKHGSVTMSSIEEDDDDEHFDFDAIYNRIRESKINIKILTKLISSTGPVIVLPHNDPSAIISLVHRNFEPFPDFLDDIETRNRLNRLRSGADMAAKLPIIQCSDTNPWPLMGSMVRSD